MPKFLGLDYALPVRITSMEPDVTVQHARSGKRFVERGDAQYWQLAFRTKPLPKKSADVRKVLTHLVTNNLYTPFNVQFPQPLDIVAYPASTIEVNGAHNAGVNVISVTTTGAAFLSAGIFFKFTGHKKLYMLSSDASRADAGSLSLNIIPYLQKNLVDDTVVTFAANPIMRAVYAESQSFGVTYPPGGLVSYSIALDEDLD